ncbi:MAG: hypothetical protein FDZ75_09110 [Actinobacteria bacterium]|nr:MAG: hypothetical protein FDZ75_09110 [Actinomycetota bacterium]
MLAWILMAALIVSAILFGAYRYAYSKAYLQLEADGRVYVYQGVPGQFGSLKLSRFVNATEIPPTNLTPAQQAKLREGVQYDSLADAQRAVSSLENSPTPGVY